MANFVTTGRVRLSYVHLDAPYLGANADKNAKPKYSVTILIPKDDKKTMAALQVAYDEAYNEAVQSLWNGATPGKKYTIHDGDGTKVNTGEPYGPECKGHWVMTASTVRARSSWTATSARSIRLL